METSAPTFSSFGPYLHEATFQHADCLDDRKIRLLELEFAHSDEIVCLNLQTYSIDDYPPYIALSYAWGDPTDTVNILCNGKTLAVTRNLKEALWQFRQDRKRLVRLEPSATSPGQLLHFWIDAICIDQECNKEKSFQVGMMANIYQQARHVFIWLGPADKSSDVAIRCINTIGKMAEYCGLGYSHSVCLRLWQQMAFIPEINEQLLSADKVIVETIDGSLARVSYEAAEELFNAVNGFNGQSSVLPIAELKDFFTRPWWTRIWVLQEIALSRDTYFICGTQRLPRARCSAFMNMYKALRAVITTAYHKDQNSLNEYQLDILLQLFYRRASLLLSIHKSKLVTLLRITCISTMNASWSKNQHFESTKPEDKIFALLGLAADREELKRYGVVPNYNIPYQQTYTTTMAALLQQGHISMLSTCQASSSPGSPSWVPDWSWPNKHKSQESWADLSDMKPPFSCSGRRKHGASTIKVFNDNGIIRSISIKSYLYDEVCRVGCLTSRNHEGLSDSQAASWSVDWLLEILRLSYCRRKDYKGFHNRLRASARTCIGEIGWNADGDKERVGNSRYSDAVCLLHEGLQRIKKGRLKIDIHRFLNSDKVDGTLKDRNRYQIPLVTDITRKMSGLIPFVTRKGHIGLGPQHIMPGDVIAIIEGGQAPFVFRREDKGQFSLVSDAYVDGIMDGEVAETGNYSYVTLV